jgi:hypothetical protein
MFKYTYIADELKKQKTVKSTPVKNRLQQTALNLIIHPATIKDAIFQHSVLCQMFLLYRNPDVEVSAREQMQEMFLWLPKRRRLLIPVRVNWKWSVCRMVQMPV